jgi:UDP-N-acetylmuramoyl-tripeptide--D-alanyl-D-alanine ligase
MKMAEIYNLYVQNPSIQTDTRKLKRGDIYWALKGERFNGNQFAAQALEAGASYAVVDEADFMIHEKCILVEDGLKALQQLALHHRQQLQIPFIAITGSNGKTTTKELIYAVLSSSYKTAATIGNLNNHIGVPLTILSIPRNTEMAIIEMGANHQKEIASYCDIALPTHGLINNCGKAHLEGFGGIEGVRKGKGELYDFIRKENGSIFLNFDLSYLKEMAQGISKQITYGEYEGDYRGKVISSSEDNETLSVAILNAGNECIIHSQLVGDYNFANIMAAVAVGRTFGISIDTIKKAIENYAPSNSRSQLMKLGSNTIILDAYNANPSSMQLAIQNFARMNFVKKIIMIGGMMELGEDSLNEHQQIILLLEQLKFTQVVLVGGDFEKAKHSFIYFENSTQAQVWFKQQTLEDAAILIKGSRAFAMEKVIQ